MKKIQKLGQSVFLILLIVSCGELSFHWKAHPYVFDTAEQRIIDKDGNYILFTDNGIEDYIAFSSDNIADLKAEIDRINMSDKDRKKVSEFFEDIVK